MSCFIEALAEQSNCRAPQPEPSTGSSSSSAFFGSGNTLGSDEVPSRVIPDPTAPARGSGDDEEVAIREITFWKDGFTIHDRPLLRYDVPESASILKSIETG